MNKQQAWIWAVCISVVALALITFINLISGRYSDQRLQPRPYSQYCRAGNSSPKCMALAKARESEEHAQKRKRQAIDEKYQQKLQSTLKGEYPVIKKSGDSKIIVLPERLSSYIKFTRENVVTANELKEQWPDKIDGSSIQLEGLTYSEVNEAQGPYAAWGNLTGNGFVSVALIFSTPLKGSKEKKHINVEIYIYEQTSKGEYNPYRISDKYGSSKILPLLSVNLENVESENKVDGAQIRPLPMQSKAIDGLLFRENDIGLDSVYVGYDFSSAETLRISPTGPIAKGKYRNSHLKIEEFYRKALPDNLKGARPLARRGKYMPEIVLPEKLSEYLKTNFPDYRPVNLMDYVNDHYAFSFLHDSFLNGRLPFIAWGDFFGNGTIDVALTMRDKKFPGNYFLLILNQDQHGSFVSHVREYMCSIDSCGIALGKRGIGSDYEGTPFNLEHEGVEIMYYEKASSIWYWQDGKVLEYATSD